LQSLRELQHTAKPAKSISLADFSLDWDPSQMAGPFSSALSFASSSTHARRLKQRPDISAAVSADGADETLFQIGQAHVVGLFAHLRGHNGSSPGAGAGTSSGGAGAGTGSANAAAGGTGTGPVPKLPWLDMSNWDHEPIPDRKWAIPDCVPLNQVGLFSGEGGTRLTSNAVSIR